MVRSPPGSSVHGFSRQEYWSGWPFSSPGDLSNPGIEPRFPALWADSLPAEPQGRLLYSNSDQPFTRLLRYNKFDLFSLSFSFISITQLIPHWLPWCLWTIGLMLSRVFVLFSLRQDLKRLQNLLWEHFSF